MGDVYFVIFRHKWKIIILSLVGITAAGVFYLLKPPLYQSEAELLIRYITDVHAVSAPADNTTMTSANMLPSTSNHFQNSIFVSVPQSYNTPNTALQRTARAAMLFLLSTPHSPCLSLNSLR